MQKTFQLRFMAGALTLIALLIAGCSSATRTTVEGYTDQQLSGKRVVLLLPDAADVRIPDSSSYAFARGTVAESAREQLAIDFRTRLIPALDLRLDSNTVLNYAEQPVSGNVALNARTDFPNGAPKAWDVLKRAGREGNIDFMIVLNNMQVRTIRSTNGSGSETIEADYILLDLQDAKAMTSGHVTANIDGAADPGATYRLLAQQLAAKFPFHVDEDR